MSFFVPARLSLKRFTPVDWIPEITDCPAFSQCRPVFFNRETLRVLFAQVIVLHSPLRAYGIPINRLKLRVHGVIDSLSDR